ncbi:MerR family transcriptional regulator [Nocardioides koreensis]|uniref:MerR family transcriptional regulator n=1 Tax=Nocardioides koreensis TaxID=433651 RepID=A0ABP5L4F7_9ACTN
MATEAGAPRPMQIGEIAERTGLSLRTLRHYDEIGLLTPSARTEGGFRLYTAEDLEKLLVVRRMKPLGFSLEAMHEVMGLIEAIRDQGDDPDPELVERLRLVADDARERRRRLEEQVAMADEFLEQLGRQLP